MKIAINCILFHGVLKFWSSIMMVVLYLCDKLWIFKKPVMLVSLVSKNLLRFNAITVWKASKVSLFSHNRTEYGYLRSKSQHSVRIRENKDQKKLRIWTLLTQCIVRLMFKWYCLTGWTKRCLLFAFCYECHLQTFDKR